MATNPRRPRHRGRDGHGRSMTKTRWVDIKEVLRTRRCRGELQGLWFHDLRRSFVTRARRVGVPESVVMRMSGHRTRAVFERYNVVDTQDLRAAVRALESLGNEGKTKALPRWCRQGDRLHVPNN
jgi:integrase